MEKEKIKIGIIGTGRIAKRFVTDAWQKLDVEIVGVYNPHENSARSFCEQVGINIDCAFSKWDRFVTVIDAAYVASPLCTHYDYIEKLLNLKVHVLCEKPMVVSQEQAKTVYALAKTNNCVLMEGIKTAYSPGFKQLMEQVGSEKIGDIADVEACFTKLVRPGLREWTHIADCGSMTELGTYGCFVVTKILGWNFTRVYHFSIRNGDGVDKFTKVFFEYDNNAIGLAKAGIGVKSEGELIISGTKGYILVKAPWWMPRCIEVHYEDTNKTETYQCDYEGNGLQYELEHFISRIRGNNVKEVISVEQSIAIAGIMEKFLREEKKYRKY